MSQEAYIDVELVDEQRNITASVQSLRIEDHDRLVDEATIVLSDPDALGSATLSENQKVRITMGWESEHAVLFEGMIRTPASAATSASRRTSIIAHDLSFGMTIDRQTRPHEGTLKDVVGTVVFNYGFDDENIVTPDPSPTFDLTNNRLNQADTTDWDFVQRLADRYRCVAFVEFNGDSRRPTAEGRSRFYFMPLSRILEQPVAGTLRYCQGMSQLIDFRFQKIASQAAAMLTPSAVDRMTGEVRTGTPPTPTPTPPPSLDPSHAGALAAGGRSTVADSALTAAGSTPDRMSQMPTGTASGAPSDAESVDVGSQVDPTRTLGLFGRGRAVGTVYLRAKSRVHIEGIPDWAAGDWYVKRAVHIYTREGASPRYATEFLVTR